MERGYAPNLRSSKGTAEPLDAVSLFLSTMIHLSNENDVVPGIESYVEIDGQSFLKRFVQESDAMKTCWIDWW